MWGYIVRRLLLGIPTLLGVTIIVFSLMHLAPGIRSAPCCRPTPRRKWCRWSDSRWGSINRCRSSTGCG